MRTDMHAANSPSSLMICDSLLRLAQEADRAGCESTAEHLFQLALVVLDDPEVQTPARLRDGERARPARRRFPRCAPGPTMHR